MPSTNLSSALAQSSSSGKVVELNDKDSSKANTEAPLKWPKTGRPKLLTNVAQSASSITTLDGQGMIAKSDDEIEDLFNRQEDDDVEVVERDGGKLLFQFKQDDSSANQYQLTQVQQELIRPGWFSTQLEGE